MNSCLLQYQGPEEMDKARAEWFTLAGERRRQKEEEQRKLEEARRQHKEWWNLDEHGKLMGKKAEVDDKLPKR
jgi:COX assembly protein 1